MAALNIFSFATGVIRNTGTFLLAQIASRIINFVFMVYLASHLPVAQFGALNVALTILIVADTLADLGLSKLIVRTLSRDPHRVAETVGSLIPLKLLLSMFVYCVCVAGVLLGGQGPEVSLFIFIIGASLLLSGVASVLEGVLQSQHKFGVVGVGHIVLSIVQAATGVGVVTVGGSLAALAMTFLVSNFAFLVVLATGVARTHGLGPFRFVPAYWRAQLSQSLPYALTAIVVIFSMRCELLILSWVANPEQVAYFSIAVRLNEAAILPSIVLSTVLMPLYSRYHHDGTGTLAQSYAIVLRWGLVSAVPASVLAALLANPVIDFILPSYTSSSGLAALMFLAMPLFAVLQLNYAVLLGSDQQGRTMLVLAGIAILQFMLGLGFIVSHAANGAAVSYAIWAFAAAVVSTLYTRSRYMPNTSLGRAILPTLAGVASTGTVWMALRMDGLILQIPVMMAVYVVTVWLVMHLQGRASA